MRSILPCLGLLLATGCGDESDKPAPAISLSIPNPEAKSGNSAASGDVVTAQPQPSITSPAVEQLVARAKQAVISGRNAIAVESLSQAIGVTPNDARLLRMRADVYSVMGEFANARADFSMAIQADPQNASLYNIRGYFLMTRGLTNEALQDFEQAIELNPGLAEALNNRGLIGLAKNDYNAAQADFTAAIEQNRKYADAWNNRGFSRMKAGQLDSALTDLQQALKLNPEYLTAWNNCGLVHMQREDFESAAEAFTKAIDLAPLDVRWFNHRRAAWQKLERFAEAAADERRIRWLTGLETLTRRVAADAGNPAAWTTRADYLAAGDQFGAAIQDYSRALALQPGQAEALTGRAKAWMRTGQLQKAMNDCDESLVIAKSAEAFSIRADAWLAMENYDQAVQDFEAAQRFDGQVAEAYLARGKQREAAGEAQLAQQDFEKAEEITAVLEGRSKSKNREEVALEPFDATLE